MTSHFREEKNKKEILSRKKVFVAIFLCRHIIRRERDCVGVFSVYTHTHTPI